MSQFNVDAQSLLIILGAIFIIFLIFRIFKAMLRVVMIVIVLVVALYFIGGGNLQGFKETTQGISNIAKAAKEAGLEEFFNKLSLDKNANVCEEVRNEAKCECIYKPLHQDLISRLSPEEIQKATENNDYKMAEIKTSMKNMKQVIKQCLLERNSHDLHKAIDTFVEVTGNAN
ncbi:MAG: hypothetical protein OHK0038_15550 [Flammeovirgaceae bacterium]